MLIIFGAVIFVVIAGIFSNRWRRQNTVHSKLPPCLPRYSILGNIIYLIKNRTPIHSFFASLTKDLGPVFTFWFGDSPVIVINDFYVAKTVLYSKEWSGRPQRHTGEIYSRGFKGVITTDVCPMLDIRRNITNKSLKFLSSTRIESILRIESNSLIQSIKSKMGTSLSFNIDFTEDILLFSCNVTWMLLFRKKLSAASDEFREVADMMNWLNGGLTLSNLLQGFPILRKIPLGKFLFLDAFKKSRDRIIKQYNDLHKQSFDANRMEDLNHVLLSHNVLSSDNVEIILSDIFIASFETVSSTLLFMILHLMKYKQIAKKCYDEVDSKLGADHLKLEDIDKFSYIKAVISETLRLSPVAPLGVPHKTVKDVSIMNFNIPQNTTVFVNIYAIHRDHNLHKIPELFNPERFLDENKQYKNIDGFLPFSLGRRKCLGKDIAMKELLYVSIVILQNFWLDAPDNYDFNDDCIANTILKPRPYETKVTKRLA